MDMQHTATKTSALAVEVEGILDSPEQEGVYRDSRECAGILLVVGGLLLAPPTPRPKKP